MTHLHFVLDTRTEACDTGPMMKRHGNTARVIAADGDWMKLGRKHYRHGSGIEVRYNDNRWGWEVVDRNELYTALWAAKHRAEKLALDIRTEA